ncbi:MAG: LysE family translocator [Deltaproteobacteria bacterium]|nr:LysE family translocator [Deltaproteobacteria bacterium]
MTLYSATGFAVAMFVLAASPGPGVFATVARALASGFRPALAVIVGIVAGDIIFLLFAIFGLSVVAKVMGEFFIIVKICGSAYLIFLGVKIWFSKPEHNTAQNGLRNSTAWGNCIGGLVITLSNPKVILFYCGFLPTFLNLSTLTFAGMALALGIVTVVLTAVLVLYAFMASRARRMLTGPKSIKRMNRAAGGVMIAAGVAIAVRS